MSKTNKSSAAILTKEQGDYQFGDIVNRQIVNQTYRNYNYY